MTSDRLLPGDVTTSGAPSIPELPPVPGCPPPEPVSRVDWFRRAPNGGTVNFAPHATSGPPRDPGGATTER
jgi:hypothetical protein